MVVRTNVFLSNEERSPRADKDVFETLGGPIYHGADSHFSNYFVKHGKGFDIEVAINNYDDNPVGIQDMLVYLSHFISNILNNRIFLVFDCRRLLE